LLLGSLNAKAAHKMLLKSIPLHQFFMSRFFADILVSEYYKAKQYLEKSCEKEF